eukprot:CAMPEP_0113578060 /NCGR_PEP_ID=MMETSP0015_2-20120614/29248_1 /TAXON_ID=2838 /ORGANISM="Odontella" /LENGTH=207 /DNA_ID=CAMNT_0000481777 /DNA_START=79 /DNA_END=698 /DNA_ORIENTATION=+ /assembly_acc=CAM_ASM_000160
MKEQSTAENRGRTIRPARRRRAAPAVTPALVFALTLLKPSAPPPPAVLVGAMRIDGPPPQGGGDCSVDGNGKLPSSCFDWVARALVPSAAPGDDDDERRSRLRREQVREEYRVAYASLAGMKKRRLRKDCCNYEDGLLRGLCFGYWTCIEAGKQRCQVVKEKLDTLPQQISVLDAAIRRVAEGSIGNDVEDWKLGADFVALMAGTAG